MLVDGFEVDSPNVTYTEDHITAKYVYETTDVVQDGGTWKVKPRQIGYEFKTDKRVPKLGIMLVGWGGNNGSTVTAGILANKGGLSWKTKDGVQHANYWGSVTQAATCRIGNFNGEEVHVPFKNILPMVSPNDVAIGGWDISAMNLAESMERSRVLDYDLQMQLWDQMKDMVPLPSIYDPQFIAANQAERADNCIAGSKAEQVEQIRRDIKDFKAKNALDSVVVLWTANTERYSEVVAGMNDTKENLQRSIEAGESEISPSTLFAWACITDGVPFVNGSPQNTFVPGVIDYAVSKKSFIGGDDFKSGQTKMKSVLVDFLVGAGIKPVSIVSYNHLGNNDGYNLSAPQTFRSKEISKSNVVDDMVQAAQGGLLDEKEWADLDAGCPAEQRPFLRAPCAQSWMNPSGHR